MPGYSNDGSASDTDPVCGTTVQTGHAGAHTTNSQNDPTLQTFARPGAPVTPAPRRSRARRAPEDGHQ